MEIVIPEGLYKVYDIDKYLKRAIFNSRPDNATKKKTYFKDKDKESKYPLIIHNNNTIKSETKCDPMNFIKSVNIRSLLIFPSYTEAATLA